MALYRRRRKWNGQWLQDMTVTHLRNCINYLSEISDHYIPPNVDEFEHDGPLYKPNYINNLLPSDWVEVMECEIAARNSPL